MIKETHAHREVQLCGEVQNLLKIQQIGDRHILLCIEYIIILQQMHFKHFVSRYSRADDFYSHVPTTSTNKVLTTKPSLHSIRCSTEGTVG